MNHNRSNLTIYSSLYMALSVCQGNEEHPNDPVAGR